MLENISFNFSSEIVSLNFNASTCPVFPVYGVISVGVTNGDSSNKNPLYFTSVNLFTYYEINFGKIIYKFNHI